VNNGKAKTWSIIGPDIRLSIMPINLDNESLNGLGNAFSATLHPFRKKAVEQMQMLALSKVVDDSSSGDHIIAQCNMLECANARKKLNFNRLNQHLRKRFRRGIRPRVGERQLLLERNREISKSKFRKKSAPIAVTLPSGRETHLKPIRSPIPAGHKMLLSQPKRASQQPQPHKKTKEKNLKFIYLNPKAIPTTTLNRLTMSAMQINFSSCLHCRTQCTKFIGF
jgi:hypothetical protein